MALQKMMLGNTRILQTVVILDTFFYAVNDAVGLWTDVVVGMMGGGFNGNLHLA